jgi:hypothetical protein
VSALLRLVLGIVGLFAQPWVLQLGWNWHLAPAFDIPRLTYALAWVIYALAGLCTLQFIPRGEDDQRWGVLAFEWPLTVITLFIVWVTK